MIKLTLIDYFYKMTKLSSLYCNKKRTIFNLKILQNQIFI